MSNKIEFLTSSQAAIEHLRCDVAAGQIMFYTLPDFPKGIFHEGYAEKCYSFVAAVSGSRQHDYLVVLALRPDWATSGDEKVIDIDTATFCLKTDDLASFPTGAAFFHQKFPDRTTPLSGYAGYSLPETINDLHSKLVPGSMPLSASPKPYLNAISHSVARFNQLLGPQVSGWNSQSANAERPDL
jgi:hypothetical protein